MSEMKPCPFCGKKPNPNWTDESYIECTNRKCSVYGYGMSTGDWNTRPIEDALQARIAELELGLNNQTVHSNTLQKILTEKLDRITELEAAQRWVPVSEGTKGLEILEDYLTTDESGEISKMKYCGVLRGVQKWLWSDNAFYHPTHWMPLPQPPEAQQ